VRRAVWTDRKRDIARKTPNEALPHLFDDLSSYGWEERMMEFDLAAPNQIDLKKALARFAHETDDTMHGGVEVATHQMDAWAERELGPSAAGKIASSSFWYIYFRKEGNDWKIWKLELAVH
jgi:hypothetical protein